MTTNDTDSLLTPEERALLRPLQENNAAWKARVKELEAQLEAWKATAEQFKVSWGNEREVLQRENAELKAALEKSVELQSHYAKLLNMHDGGERIGFKNADAWITRLKSMRGGGK